MNRNTESRFAQIPHVNVPRSTRDMEFPHKLTFNVGQLVILAAWPTVPGDTFQVDQHQVIRTTTTVVPVMDNLYWDTYAFWAPTRQLWIHQKEFMGQNTLGVWAQTTQYSVPQLTTPTGGAAEKTLMHHLGVPINVAGLSFSAIPIRLYAKIVNNFFRDQNVTTPLTEYDDDTNRTADNTVTELGGQPFIAAKFHDYFTSALPSPEKSPTGPVTMPIGVSAPVWGNGKTIGFNDGTNDIGFTLSSDQQNRSVLNTGGYNKTVGATVTRVTDAASLTGIGIVQKATGAESGLYADLSAAVSATINAQRYAIALQQLYELDARGGTYYDELLAQYGVQPNNIEIQIPEYLGGKRVPLSLSEIAQTSETGTTPLGSSAGLSVTGDSDRLFTKSFTEPGWVLVVGVVRYRHTYSQGLNRNLSKKLRFDFFHPLFIHLGEQPIYNKEIYAQGPSVINANTGKAYDDEIFGYQERYAELNYMPGIVSGEFDPRSATSIAYWTYADYYSSLPVLSTQFLQEDKDNVDRTLAVSSQLADQIRVDYLLKMKATRPLPIYCIPGLDRI